VAIISHGEVLAVGETDELIRELGSLAVWRAAPAAKAEALLREAGVEVLDAGGDNPGTPAEILVRMEQERVPELTRKLVYAGIAVYGIEMRNPTLEDLFLSLTEGERIE
jgi:ABC-2 type transport system ATP-binding protein